jgi:hypothetical protein
MDISKNKQVDLLYLTNPNFKIKYNKEITKIVDENDVKFYRKRILQDTKELLRGNNINEDVNGIFDKYCNTLIKYYKFCDKKKEIQKEYKNLPEKEKEEIKDFQLQKENELMFKRPEIIKKTIKDFIPIVVKERRKKNIIMPKKKTYDLKNPKNREKEKSKQFISNGKKNKKKNKKKKETK